MKKYKEYHFIIPEPEQQRAILIAWLSAFDFEGFVETPDGFLAYTCGNMSPDAILKDISIPYQWTVKEVQEENWNKTWEQQIKPLIIDDKIYIRTSFHPNKNYPVVITIDPKMSFGTGHHETTYLMIKQLMEISLGGKELIDMGAGTGVLSILSKKLGSGQVYAIDNDKWAYENMLENFQANQIDDIQAYLGDANTLSKLPQVDIFLANINRNILLQDIETYAKHIKPEGNLILSGFYEVDVPLLILAAEKNGMVFENKKVKNRWTSLKFIKKTA